MGLGLGLIRVRVRARARVRAGAGARARAGTGAGARVRVRLCGTASRSAARVASALDATWGRSALVSTTTWETQGDAWADTGRYMGQVRLGEHHHLGGLRGRT